MKAPMPTPIPGMIPIPVPMAVPLTIALKQLLNSAHDTRLSETLHLIRSKQDAAGRWPLEYGYAGKTWVDFGAKKQANPWVTLRALRVLKAAA